MCSPASCDFRTPCFRGLGSSCLVMACLCRYHIHMYWPAAVYKMEGLKRDANTLNKEIGTLRKVLKAAPLFHGTATQESLQAQSRI